MYNKSNNADYNIESKSHKKNNPYSYVVYDALQQWEVLRSNNNKLLKKCINNALCTICASLQKKKMIKKTTTRVTEEKKSMS